MKPNVIGPAQLQANVVDSTVVSNEAIVELKLSTAVQTKLISVINQTVPDSAYPQYWTVIGRGSSMMTFLTRTLTLRDPSVGTSDLLMAQNSSYSDIASILSSGAYLSNRATAGVILKSLNGHY